MALVFFLPRCEKGGMPVPARPSLMVPSKNLSDEMLNNSGLVKEGAKPGLPMALKREQSPVYRWHLPGGRLNSSGYTVFLLVRWLLCQQRMPLN
jgi:hypothetical protein